MVGGVLPSTGGGATGGDRLKMNEKRNSDRRRTDVQTRREPDMAESRLRQQAIGVRLRTLFDEVVSEPVPDEFLAILQKADDRKKGNA